jgi:hypothetical protein
LVVSVLPHQQFFVELLAFHALFGQFEALFGRLMRCTFFYDAAVFNFDDRTQLCVSQFLKFDGFFELRDALFEFSHFAVPLLNR